MKPKPYIKIWWFLSLISAVLIALFWVIYGYYQGGVPVVTEIKAIPSWSLPLPISMSRWLDISIGPIWSFILVFSFTRVKENKYDLVFGLFISLMMGLITAMPEIGIGFVPIAGVIFGIIVGLNATPIVRLTASLSAGFVFGTGAGLGVGLTFGLVARFIAGLGGWLIFSISAWLGSLLRSLIKNKIKRIVA